MQGGDQMKAVLALFTGLSIVTSLPASALTLQEWGDLAESSPPTWSGYLLGVLDTIYNTSPDDLDYAE